MKKQFYLILLVCMISITAASASAYTYIGGGPDGYWNTIENWSPQGVPGSGDIVNIGNGGPTLVGNTEVALSIFPALAASTGHLALPIA